MEAKKYDNPLEELQSLRKQVDTAETAEQIQELNEEICRVIRTNQDLTFQEIEIALGVSVEQQISQTVQLIREDIFKRSPNSTLLKEYFKNPQNVKADLDALAKELGEGNSPLDLNTSNIRKLEITYPNGEKITGPKYLRRAGIALGLAKNQTEANSIFVKTLKELLKIAGFDLQKCSLRRYIRRMPLPMNKEYFENPQNVKTDLKAFAKKLGKDKTPLDLNTSNAKKSEIKCSNGEKVKWISYLLRAGVALGFAKSQTEANSMSAKILKSLLTTAGY